MGEAIGSPPLGTIINKFYEETKKQHTGLCYRYSIVRW